VRRINGAAHLRYIRLYVRTPAGNPLSAALAGHVMVSVLPDMVNCAETDRSANGTSPVMSVHEPPTWISVILRVIGLPLGVYVPLMYGSAPPGCDITQLPPAWKSSICPPLVSCHLPAMEGGPSSSSLLPQLTIAIPNASANASIPSQTAFFFTRNSFCGNLPLTFLCKRRTDLAIQIYPPIRVGYKKAQIEPFHTFLATATQGFVSQASHQGHTPGMPASFRDA